MKKILPLLLVLVLALSLTACSSAPDKQPAIDAFNKAGEAYNEVAMLINDNSEMVDPDMLSTFQDLDAVMTAYSELLSGDQELTQEQIDEIIKWSGEAEEWSVKMRESFEVHLAG